MMTHMHFDQGGTLGDFPNATFHVQRAELASIAGAGMGHRLLAEVCSADHVGNLIRANFEGALASTTPTFRSAPGSTRT